MATLITVIGTAVTLLGFLLDQVPEGPNQAKVSFVIANNGATGPQVPGELTNAGGDIPDIRHFDDTAEFLGANYDGADCPEGYTSCTANVNTQEAVTYTLFSGNTDAICIAWTGVAWAGGQKKYGFHPGNWAYACDHAPWYTGGNWFYAGTQAPGISNEEDLYCAWVDLNGDVSTTGFQVHWPEFDGQNSAQKSLDYYCSNNPPFEFRTDYDPGSIAYWQRKRNAAPRAINSSMASAQNGTLASKFDKDPRIIKSHFAKHSAEELCDRSRKAVGQSFVSYAEQKFCFMPTKTLFNFCENVEEGACWSEVENRVVPKNTGNSRIEIPDLSHIDKIIVWGAESSK